MASLSDDTTITPTSSHTYSARFPEQWCIGAVPHGGYITTCFMRVAALHFATTLSRQQQPDTMTLHLEFVRRTRVGPATFTVHDVKLGRATSTIHIALSQAGQDAVVAYVTHTNLSLESGPSHDTGWNPPRDPPILPVDLAALTRGTDANWAERRVMPHAAFRKAGAHVRFHFPRAGQPQPSVADHWLCFRRSSERFTNASLGFVVDMFPQLHEVLRAPAGALDPYSIAAEEAQAQAQSRISQDSDSYSKKEKQKKTDADPDAKFWYPTLLLNLEVKKRLPDEGVEWLLVRTRAKVIRNGRYDLEVVVWDASGDVVALSHHVCMILSSERNLAQRRPKVERGREGKL